MQFEWNKISLVTAPYLEKVFTMLRWRHRDFPHTRADEDSPETDRKYRTNIYQMDTFGSCYCLSRNTSQIDDPALESGHHFVFIQPLTHHHPSEWLRVCSYQAAWWISLGSPRVSDCAADWFMSGNIAAPHFCVILSVTWARTSHLMHTVCWQPRSPSQLSTDCRGNHLPTSF